MANEFDDILSEEGTAPPENPFDALVAEEADTETALLDQAGFAAKTQKPASYAVSVETGRRTGVPPEIVAKNPDSVQKADLPDHAVLQDKAPSLSSFLEDPKNYSASSDDIEHLAGMEKLAREAGFGPDSMERYFRNHELINGPSPGARAFESGVNSAIGGLSGIPAFLTDVAELSFSSGVNKGFRRLLAQSGILPKEAQEGIAAPFQRERERSVKSAKLADALSKEAASFVPELSASAVDEIGKGNFKDAARILWYKTLQNSPNQAMILTGALTGVGTLALGGMGLQSSSGKAQESREKGVPLAPATIDATLNGVFEAGFEKVGTFGIARKWAESIAKSYGKETAGKVIRDFLKTAAHSALGEGNEEFWTSIAQDMSSYLTGVDPKALDGMWSRAMESALLGASSGVAMTAPSATAAGMARAKNAARANKSRDNYLKYGEMHDSSKNTERAPSVQAEFEKELVRDTPTESVHVWPDKLNEYYQSTGQNVSEAMDKAGLRDTYEDAKRNGTQMVVPINEFAAGLPATDYQGLADHISFSPSEMSVAETTKQEEQVREEAKKAELNKREETAQVESEEIAKDLTGQFVKAGYEKGMAAKLSKAASEFYRVQAIKSGKGVKELAQSEGLQIRGVEKIEPGKKSKELFQEADEEAARKQAEQTEKNLRLLYEHALLNQKTLPDEGFDEWKARVGRKKEAPRPETPEEIEAKNAAHKAKLEEDKRIFEANGEAAAYAAWKSDGDAINQPPEFVDWMAQELLKEWNGEKSFFTPDGQSATLNSEVTHARQTEERQAAPLQQPGGVLEQQVLLGDLPPAEGPGVQGAQAEGTRDGETGRTPKAPGLLGRLANRITGLELFQENRPTLSQVETQEFKKWFGDSKVVDANGKPLVVYHGTGRPERIGERFRKTRATSGPQAFFTDNPEIASNYAKGKVDTSRKAEDEGNYESWFKFKPKGLRNPIKLPDAWNYLSSEQQEKISKLAPRVRENDEGEIYLAEEGETQGIGNYDLEIKQAKGNHLKALIESWLTSGALFNQEEEFAKVLKTAGFQEPIIEDFPDASFPGVFPAFLSIQNPMRTTEITEEMVEELAKRAARQKSFTGLRRAADPWDKMDQTPEQWMERLRDDFKEKKSSFAWSSIPDWVTKFLKEKGYDGIIDTGGKMGGMSHGVYIPFEDAQIKSATGNRGTFDPADPNILHQDLRGRYYRDQFDKAVVELSRARDLSTALHELSHHFMDVVARLAKEPDASQEVKDQYEAMLEYVGAKPGEKLSVAQHEKLAKAAEVYFEEGNAPNKSLQSLFRSFRAWILNVYRGASEKLGVELTPEIRKFFDGLFATQEEIAAANEETEFAPPLEEAKLLGLSGKDAENWSKALNEATIEAEEKVSAKLMKEMRRSRTAEWKRERKEVLADIIKQVNAEKPYIALAVMETGKMPDGSALPPPLRPFKLNIGDIQENYGAKAVKALPSKILDPAGIDLDTAADLVGFSSGDEMLSALVAAEPKEERIERLTDQSMQAKYGDIIDDGLLPGEAMNAVHNDRRAEFIRRRMEIMTSEKFSKFKGMAKKLAKPVPTIQEIKQQAERTIDGKRVRFLNPNLYHTAEKRASREAFNFLFKGEFEFAFDAYKRQLINHELYRAATKAREMAAKDAENNRRYGKTATRAAIGKGGQNYLEQIDSIVDRFDFANVPIRELEARESLREWADQQTEKGMVPLVFDRLYEPWETNWRDMTVEELRGVTDTLKNIEHLARMENATLQNIKNQEFSETKEELIKSIKLNSKRPIESDLEPRAERHAAKNFIEYAVLFQRKFSSMMREMDGFKDGGDAWEYFVRGGNKAADKEASMKERAFEAINKIFKEAYSPRELGFNNAVLQTGMAKRAYIPEIKSSLSKWGRLMVALNWGNESNQEALMNGRGWTRSQVMAILDTLDERDWKVVQSIWDHMETYWPAVKELNQKVAGLAPEKIEHVPFRTKFGVVSGGYFPLKYESKQDPKAVKQIDEEELLQAASRGMAVRATTKHGHRENRLKNVSKPVRLDIGVMFEHLNDVIHDISHFEYIVDANKMLRDPEFRQVVLENYGDKFLAEMSSMVKDIAVGDIKPENIFLQGLDYLRKGNTIAKLGWNATTALIQFSGISQSMVRVGPKWIGLGLKRYLRNPIEATRDAKSHSDFLRLRSKTQQKEIAELRGQLKISGVLDQITNSFFYFIAKAQQVVDVITWHGAYEKAMADREDFQKGYDLADQAVKDAQGGGQMIDLAKTQRSGPAVKLFTAFSSFFTTTFNETYEQIHKTNFKKPGQVASFGANMLLLYTMPVVMGLIIRELMGQGDDDKELAEKLIREHLAYLASTSIGTREFSGLLSGFDYKGPAGLQPFVDMAKLYKQVEQGEMDEGFWHSLLDVTGEWLHLPARRVQKIVEGTMAYLEGETENPAAILAGPPR